MLTIEKTNELLKSISNDSMELDENLCCKIAVKDDFAITLRLSQEDGRLYAVSVIGELPEDSSAAFALAKIMLKTNFSGMTPGGTPWRWLMTTSRWCWKTAIAMKAGIPSMPLSFALPKTAPT